MKKSTVILVAVIICLYCPILLFFSFSENLNDNSISNENVTSEIHNTTAIKNFKYNDLVLSIVKKHLDTDNCDISRTFIQDPPYYTIECKIHNLDINKLENFSMDISQKIYNDLINYDFGDDINDNKIISISYYVYENNRVKASFCVQFDLSDIDQSKSFEDNLKMHQMIYYPSILY